MLRQGSEYLSRLNLPKIGCFVSIIAFLLIISQTTADLYIRRTRDHRVLIPENIVAGKSQAPNQYRILSPFLFHALDTTLIHHPRTSDRMIIFLSILFAYTATGALFYRSSRSLTLTLIGLLAVLGCFAFGMKYKYRQEFFEVAFTSIAFLSLISIRKVRLMYLLLALVTLLGGFTRETYIFCVIAMAVHIIWERIIIHKENIKPHAIGISMLFAAFAVTYVWPRWYFGLSSYHSELWTFSDNIINLISLESPYNIGHLGAGILFVYIVSVFQGNRRYLPFILGYTIPLFSVAYFISAFEEHRIYYPLMVYLLASMLSFLSERTAQGSV